MIELDGVKLHVQVHGASDAPVVVLAHGLGNDLHLWDPQISSLARHFRVVRFDVLGHGKSSGLPGRTVDLETLAAHILGILDSLGIEHASMIGTSMGAVLGLAAAAKAPQRFSRLVLCGARLHTEAGAVEELRARAARVGREGISDVAGVMMRRWFPHGGLRVPADIVARVRRTLVGTSAVAYAACAEALVEYDLRSALRALSVPTLLLAGALDEDISQQFEFLGGTRPDLHVVTLDAVGHFPNLQNAEAFNAAARGFLLGQDRDVPFHSDRRQ